MEFRVCFSGATKFGRSWFDVRHHTESRSRPASGTRAVLTDGSRRPRFILCRLASESGNDPKARWYRQILHWAIIARLARSDGDAEKDGAKIGAAIEEASVTGACSTELLARRISQLQSSGLHPQVESYPVVVAAVTALQPTSGRTESSLSLLYLIAQ